MFYCEENDQRQLADEIAADCGPQATYTDAFREYARNVAIDNEIACRDQPAWILTNWDTWERNPFYTGPEVFDPESCSSDPGEAKIPCAHGVPENSCVACYRERIRLADIEAKAAEAARPADVDGIPF